MSDTSDILRLNKHLALQLGVSRREADQLIEEGRVAINGARAVIGARLTADDLVTVNNKPITTGTSLQYLLFHKPPGYVCSRRAQGDHPTIYALLPPQYHALKPAGRLDQDSSGLLLLTNDGDFAYRMTHPKFNKTKSYTVQLDQPLQPLHQQMISDMGIQLEDGRSQLTLQRAHEGDSLNWYVSMHEGRNRQIRRTFAALGYTVVKLHRTQFGNYSLGDIKPGNYQTTNIR